MQDWNLADQIAGLENAGLENAGLENARPENAGLENAGLKSTGVNAARDAGDMSSPIFWLGGTSMGISPQYYYILSDTADQYYSRPPLKPISFGYKMPPIRLSLAGGQWVH